MQPCGSAAPTNPHRWPPDERPRNRAGGGLGVDHPDDRIALGAGGDAAAGRIHLGLSHRKGHHETAGTFELTPHVHTHQRAKLSLERRRCIEHMNGGLGGEVELLEQGSHGGEIAMPDAQDQQWAKALALAVPFSPVF